MAVNPKVSLVQKYGIPLSHIDFDYVKSCEDPKILKRIIKILESGEEGSFPSLLSETQNRLRQVKPDASILSKKLSFAQKSSDLSVDEEYEDTINDVAEWIKTTTQKEEDLQSAKQISTSHMNGYHEPPVRKSIDIASMFNSEKPEQDLSIPKIINTRNIPLGASYSKWDKYDPDVELMKLDNKEKAEKLQAQRRKNLNSNSLSVGLNDNATSCLNRVNYLTNYIDYKSNNTPLRPQELAMQEKEKGNEFYKSNDFDVALLHYNTSIGIHSTLEARNNRAMAYIKLKKYHEALDDLRVVIESDPKNVKAHFRRGSCFRDISMYCLALRSFETTLKYDCTNLKAQNYVKDLKNLTSNIPPNKLVWVRDITRHYDQSVWDIEDPFSVTYMELSELIKEKVEYLYEADVYGCLTECICNLCPSYELESRKKKWSRYKMLKNKEPRKRWQFLTPDIVSALLSKSSVPEVQKPKRLNVIEIDSSKMNGHHTGSTKVQHNGVNGIDKSPSENCDTDLLNIKPVSNVYEFLQNWKIASQRNNYELYYKLLRSIKPKDLPKVISTNLDEEIMSTFLETLNQKFDPDKELDLIIEYLTAMTKVNRFNLIVKMLDNKVKEDFQPLLKRVHRHTKNNLFSALL